MTQISPDGAYIARVYYGNLGEFVAVNLRSANDPFDAFNFWRHLTDGRPLAKGDVFFQKDFLNIKALYWKGSRQLHIIYFDGEPVVRRLAKWHDVTITAERAPAEEYYGYRWMSPNLWAPMPMNATQLEHLKKSLASAQVERKRFTGPEREGDCSTWIFKTMRDKGDESIIKVLTPRSSESEILDCAIYYSQ